jgi:signal transduction histidine kinase
LATVINDLLNRIEVSFEQLQRFTADASHELRTPLTAMRSVGEVGLQDGQSPSHYREVIGSMLEENNRLTHLVDSLLLLSKADSDRIELHREQIELITFVTETTELISILADEKEQELDVAGERQVVVFADKVLFRQALLNLIDNAIKYTPAKGRIRLGISSESDNTAIINVADSGPGIPPEDHEKIFNRFYRVDKVRSRETGGAGLGLAIVRWIVTAHQGTVTLQSSHTGSTFRISIPRSS